MWKEKKKSLSYQKNAEKPVYEFGFVLLLHTEWAFGFAFSPHVQCYFAENWKHYSKIIFKCVNSAVGPIFNEKVAEKWSLWVPCIVHETHGTDKRGWKVNNIWLLFMNSSRLSPKYVRSSLKKKKKNAKRNSWIQTHT